MKRAQSKRQVEKLTPGGVVVIVPLDTSVHDAALRGERFHVPPPKRAPTGTPTQRRRSGLGELMQRVWREASAMAVRGWRRLRQRLLPARLRPSTGWIVG
jgi:hypothetical protein